MGKTEASQHDFETPVILNMAAPAPGDAHETVITRERPVLSRATKTFTIAR
jgi:hypothetical protein